VKTLVRVVQVALLLLLLTGCSAAYYGTMEKFGVAKRDILVDRVDDTRKSQVAAKEQFADALQHFIAVTKADGGDLQRKYDDMSKQFKRSEAQAKEVRERIASVEDVAQALFKEWKQEITQYTNPTLRSDSQRQYDMTHRRYDELLALMKRSAERMDPVLATFRDQVLYLKHNLNAQAIASLKGEAVTIQGDIEKLIAEMNRSIDSADKFIKGME